MHVDDVIVDLVVYMFVVPRGSALAALGAPQCRGSRFSTARSYLESASNTYCYYGDTNR